MSYDFGATGGTEYSNLPPPPSYSSIEASSNTTEDLGSVLKRLEKKLEICENRIAENETKIQRLKTDHKKEIDELRHQIKVLEGGASNVPSQPKTPNSSASISQRYRFPSTKIALQGCHNGWFISAQPDGRAECNRKKLDIWETIAIEIPSDDAEGGVYLKSHHGKYLSAQLSGQLEWNRSRKGPWERFHVHHVKDNKIALKSCHGKWVSAQPDGRIEVNREVLNCWEHFIVHRTTTNYCFLFPSKVIALQGYHKKWFVSAQPNGTVECNREHLNKWEKIKVEYEEGENTVKNKLAYTQILKLIRAGSLEQISLTDSARSQYPTNFLIKIYP